MGNKWRNQREQIKVRLAVSGRIDRGLGPWKKCLVEPFQTHPVAKVPGIEENDQRHSDQSRPDDMSNREPREPLQAVSFWGWRGGGGSPPPACGSPPPPAPRRPPPHKERPRESQETGEM